MWQHAAWHWHVAARGMALAWHVLHAVSFWYTSIWIFKDFVTHLHPRESCFKMAEM